LQNLALILPRRNLVYLLLLSLSAWLVFALLFLVVLINEGIPIVILPEVVLGGFSCAVIIRLVLAYAPARGAAKLDSVVALASE